MKKSIQQVISFMLVLCMMAMTCVSAFAADNTASAKNNSIRVMVDGKDIAFGSAAPRIIDGRTMVPFRAILENLGAAVSYDNATRMISAKLGDTELSFKASNAALTVKKPSGTSTITMDVVPYLDAKLGSTYVSARFVSQALGYKVGWDADNRCVIILNLNQLLDKLGSDFTIIGKLSQNNTDAAKTYKIAATLKTVAEAVGEADTSDIPMNSTISCGISGLLKGNTADMTAKISGDMFGMAMDEKSDVKMDLDKGVFYTRSSAFKETPLTLKDGTVVDDQTWIKMTMDDLNAIYAQMGMDVDFKSLMTMSKESSDIEAIKAVFGSVELPLDTQSYTSISAAIDLINTLFSDKAFTKTTSGDITTYTTSSKNNSLATIIATAMPGASLDYEITISEKAGVLQNYSITCNASLNGQAALTLDISGTGENSAKFEFNLTSDVVNISMNMDTTTTETNETFTTVPAEGEKVVNFSDIMAAMGELPLE